MTLEIYYISALVAIFLLLGFWIIRLEIKLKKLLAGKAKNLDESLDIIVTKIKALEGFQQKAEKHFDLLDFKAGRSIAGVETIRFNPFKGVGEGGNQSFATAFLNENGDGVVISSLYSREHTSIFSKPIKDLASSFEMSQEEREAIKQAQKTLTDTK